MSAVGLEEILISQSPTPKMCPIVKQYATACEKVHDLYPPNQKMNVPAWASLILAACFVCGEGRGTKDFHSDNAIGDDDKNFLNDKPFIGSKNISTKSIKGKEKNRFSLKVGRTLNIFPRYGSLTLTLKVWPTRLSDNWLFRERTTEIFKKSVTKTPETIKLKGVFDDDFLIDFCDTKHDLLAAFFDQFEIDGIPQAYKAFTSFSSDKSLAQALGIHPSYTNGYNSFVLVRLFKRFERSSLQGELKLNPSFLNASRKIRIGSSGSAHQFIDNFGSHIIVDYEIGDVIYQVFVFGPSLYQEMKTTYALLHQNMKENATHNQRALNIKNYFTPYYSTHIGQVKMASGSKDFLAISEKLKRRYFIFRFYQSIFHILDNKELEDELVKTDGKVIVGLKLKKITKAFPPSAKRYWLSTVLDNTLSLYYVTM